MKKIKLVLSMLVSLFVASSCTDFVDPAIPYSGFETGTYLKTITAPAAINFFDLDNATFATVLECHAVDKINNVREVEVLIRHRRGNTLTNEAKLTTIPGTAFVSVGDSKWPRASVNIKVSEALSKLGFNKSNIKGGDFLEYRLILNTLDNKTFTNSNATVDVTGGAYYNSPFLYRLAVVCPSSLAGEYEFSTTDIKGGAGATIAVCKGTKTGKVTLKAAATAGEYEVSDSSFGLFDCLYADTPPAGAVRFTDACGKIGMKGTDKYGDAYSITKFVSVTATELTFEWINTYGDGGKTTLKRSSGSWPAGLN
jgi:hypothetical protein